MSPQLQTVESYYMITDDDMEKLEKLSHKDIYWKNSHDFIRKILKLPKEYLSEPQVAWIEQILDIVQQ